MNTHGFIIPLILLTCTGVLLYSTLVFYQAYYAYLSAQLQYQTYQQEYALRGLLNQAIDEYIQRIRMIGPLKNSYAYNAPVWNIDMPVHKRARVLVEPGKEGGSTITVSIGTLSKVQKI